MSAGNTGRAAPSMNDHSDNVEWRFVVPPENAIRVVISQRQDGPFRQDAIGRDGHYYVSAEILDVRTSIWKHAPGSSGGGYPDFKTAHRLASEKWAAIIEAGSKGASA